MSRTISYTRRRKTPSSGRRSPKLAALRPAPAGRSILAIQGTGRSGARQPPPASSGTRLALPLHKACLRPGSRSRRKGAPLRKGTGMLLILLIILLLLALGGGGWGYRRWGYASWSPAGLVVLILIILL